LPEVSFKLVGQSSRGVRKSCPQRVNASSINKKREDKSQLMFEIREAIEFDGNAESLIETLYFANHAGKSSTADW
jgi:hypothetical protein